MVRLMFGIITLTFCKFLLVVWDLFLVIKGVNSEKKDFVLHIRGGEPTVIGGWMSYAFTFNFFQYTVKMNHISVRLKFLPSALRAPP